MKKRKLTVCLLAGVLLLAVSAGAAYGSVNGYAAYKDGAKALLVECGNVNLAGTMCISVDGREVVKSGEELITDGTNRSAHSWEGSREQPSYESRSVTLNGVNTHYHSGMAPKTYYSSEVPQVVNTSVWFAGDNADELERRLAAFLELAADTVMGDLKNNFVATGKEDGVSRYQVNISKNQVPALINAGLSLVAYSEASGANDSMVVYEDYKQSLAAYYERKTGSAVPEELRKNYVDGYNDDWVAANQEAVKAFDALQEQYADEWGQSLNSQGGVLYVSKDNQETRYEDKYSFYEAHPEEYENNWESLVGEDLSLETVDCSFGLDDQGRLVENDITANFTTVDAKGQSHALCFTVTLTAKDYGCAVVEPLDVTGWKNLSQEDADPVNEAAAGTEG